MRTYYLIGIVVFIFIGVALYFLIGTSISNKSQEVISNKQIEWRQGWKNKNSKYAGSEFEINILGADQITIQYTNNTRADQGIQLSIDDQKVSTSSSELGKHFLTTKLDKNVQHKIIGQHICIYLYEPCDMTINSILLPKDTRFYSSILPKKTISILGDSISTIYGKENYSFYLAKSLGYQIHNASVLGSTVSSYKMVDSLINRYQKDIKPYKSDIVIIFMGTNDAYYNIPLVKFERDYEEIVDNIQEWNPSAKIYLASLLPRTDATNGSLKQYDDVIHKIAINSNQTYIDTSTWLKKEDFSDAIHPSEKSQKKIANGFYRVIKP